MKDAEWLSYWLMVLVNIFGTVIGYDLQCPAKSEWRLRANISCYSENKYVCLFHLLDNKYEENCLGSDLSSKGNKLVFQPLFNLAECNAERFQPVVFTTHGNSACIFLKSKCDEEGQIVYSNGSTKNDTACRCDYTKGYTFISKPQNSCFCLPSKEDCSCFRAKCRNLSADYQCIADGSMIAETKCQEIHPQMSDIKHNLTVQYIESNLKSYSHANQVTCIIIVIITVCIVIIVITALKVYIFVPPKMLCQGVIISEPVGKNVVLKCIVKSYLPLTSLIWCNEHRENVLMDTKPSNAFSRKGIKPVMFETYVENESETYKCMASNMIGSVESKPVQVYGSRHEDALSSISPTTKEENQKFIKEECGKHYFARLIFVGQNGVGKTSLMRRLLWRTKNDVSSPQSTDGIEIEKCNIDVTNGKWSKCDKIDDDLARLIQQVYTKKKVKEEQESERNLGENIFDGVSTNYNEEKAKTVQGKNEEVLSEKKKFDELSSKAAHSENEEEYNINSLHEEENTKDDSESDAKLTIEIAEGREHTIKFERLQNFEIGNSNLNQTEPETIQFRPSNDITIINNEIENESGSENDENVDKLTSNIMESCLHWNEDDPLDKQAFCWLWDFAGQKDFYATHQVFLSTCAVYLLVTDSLDFSCAEKLWVDFENSAQYVRFWFDAIHCYWSSTQKNRLDPPIIVVCTKEDKFKDLTKRHQRQIEFGDSLAKVMSSQKKKAHLRNIYFVSNTEDNDDVFEEIRKSISLQAMTMNDWGRDCPLKWLLFQQVLVKLKDGEVPISKTTKLLKIAKHKQIGITDYDEFTLCLKYYHNIGTVIYFDEEILKDYVILDPKWLIDAFRCLVSDKIEKVIRVSDDWLKLKENGELTDSLISLLFEKEPNLKFSENKAHLIEVMKRFDIIVNLRNSTVFYMPCMMESCSFAKVQKQFLKQGQSFDKTSWLCLDFEFLPPAFFNHILAWYIKQYYVSVIVDKRLLYLRNALYRQIGVFDLDSSGCEKLVVCEGPNVIALQVWNSRMPAQTYGDIGKHLFQFVDTLRDRYRMKIVFAKTFKCKDGDFTIDRRKINKLITEDYHCLEHGTTHLSDDLLEPWGFRDDIRIKERKEYQTRIQYQMRLGRSISTEALNGQYHDLICSREKELMRNPMRKRDEKEKLRIAQRWKKKWERMQLRYGEENTRRYQVRDHEILSMTQQSDSKLDEDI